MSAEMLYFLCWYVLIAFTHIFYCLQVKTVKVSNVSLGANERDIKEFFSFSGDIEYVEMMRFVFLFSLTVSQFMFFVIWIEVIIFLCSDNERSQIAYVTFKDAQGSETAVLLSVMELLNSVIENEKRRLVTFHCSTFTYN